MNECEKGNQQGILVAVFRLRAADVGEIKDREMGEAEAAEQNASSETIPPSPQPQKENAVVCDIQCASSDASNTKPDNEGHINILDKALKECHDRTMTEFAKYKAAQEKETTRMENEMRKLKEDHEMQVSHLRMELESKYKDDLASAEKKRDEEMEKLCQEKTKFEDQACKMIAELFNTEQDLKECLKEMEKLDAKIAAKEESKLRLISELKATSAARSD